MNLKVFIMSFVCLIKQSPATSTNNQDFVLNTLSYIIDECPDEITVVSRLGYKILDNIYRVFEDEQSENKDICRKRLDKKLKNLPRTANNSYSIGLSSQSDKMETQRYCYGFTEKIMNTSNSEDVFNNHNIWVEYTQDLFYNRLSSSDIKKHSREYTTYSYFMASLYNDFETVEVCDNKTGTEKTFLNFKGLIKTRKEVIGDINTTIIFLPLSPENKSSKVVRYLIYVLPEENSSNLDSLSSNYIDHFKDKDLSKVIRTTKTKLVNLSIPLIDCWKCTTSFEFKTQMPEVSVKMITYLDINTTTSQSNLTDNLNNCLPFKTPKSIQVDRTYIAFIYDVEEKQTLFMIKDKRN